MILHSLHILHSQHSLQSLPSLHSLHQVKGQFIKSSTSSLVSQSVS